MTFKPQANRRGSVLLMSLVFVGIVAFALASYLALVRSESRSTIRAQTWNATMPISEAGLEEALSHLNKHTTTNLACNGWTMENGLAVMRRTFGDGRYLVAIVPTNRPIIECQAFVPAPPFYTSASVSPNTSTTTTNKSATRAEVSRCVRIQAGTSAIFVKGIVAKGTIDLRGNSVATDSFDSLDPNFSNNGHYDSGKHKDNGDVATDSGLINSLNVGNANISGRVATGPGGSVSVGPNGTVGSQAWVSGGNTGIQPSYSADNMNTAIPDVTQPFTSGWNPSGGFVSVTNTIYTMQSVTTTTFPSPLPAGGVTTNWGIVTNSTYPASTPVGGVTTNSATVVSATLPSPLPTGTITTNVGATTSTTYPASSIGPVVTNSTVFNSTTLPSPLPTGTIVTNAVFSTTRYPYSPMPDGPPSPAPTWNVPAAGTYLGAVTNRYVSNGNPSGRGWYHDYSAITTYNYTAKTYTYTNAQSYSYTAPTYAYAVNSAYTYSVCTATNTTTSVVYYDYIFDSLNYVVTGSLNGNICIRGNANVWCKNGVALSGKDSLTILPGASLNLYVSGSASLSGQGVANLAGNATNFYYYGLSDNTSISLQGNAGFVGAIYAPEANITMGGGGNDTLDFVGAIVANTVKMNGKFNMHYDENLGRSGPQGRYNVISWDEIKPGDSWIAKAGISTAPTTTQ